MHLFPVDCNGIAMRYVLPVLWMTIYFHTMGPVAKIKLDVMFSRNSPGDVPVGLQSTTVFGRVYQNAVPGAKSAIYD